MLILHANTVSCAMKPFVMTPVDCHDIFAIFEARVYEKKVSGLINRANLVRYVCYLLIYTCRYM